MAEDRLNNQSLRTILMEKHGFTKENAETFLKEFFLLIEEGLEKDGFVKVKGLGAFEIQGQTEISFTADPALRDTINKPFAHFDTIVLNEGVTFSKEQLMNTDTEPVNETVDATDGKTIPVNAIIAPATIPQTVEEEMQIIEEEHPIINEEQPTIDEEIAEIDEVTELPENTNEIHFNNENKEDKSIMEEKEKEKKGSNATPIVVAIMLTLLICGGAVLVIFYNEIFGGKKKMDSNITMPASTEKVHPIANADSLAALKTAPKDTVAKAVVQPVANKPETKKAETKKPAAKITSATRKPAVTTTTSSSARRAVYPQPPTRQLTQAAIDAIPVNPDSTSYNILGTRSSHRIKAGETLTRISYKYYGTKDLWPYLVIHNRRKIPNPNHVPAGNTILIPELKLK